jgi:hypothetical protein
LKYPTGYHVSWTLNELKRALKVSPVVPAKVEEDEVVDTFS